MSNAAEALSNLAEHVLGLEVVLGDGRILRTGSWSGRNTAPFYRYFGPDITGMFLCDSGAFGIKTKVVLQLEPITKIKNATDPDRTLNPGILGLN